MQYVALIHRSEAEWESIGDEERQALYDRYIELFGEDDRVIGGGSSSRRRPRPRSPFS